MPLLCLLTACHTAHPASEEVVCATIHRYGVPLDPSDWSARGQDGQVVSMRKNGVTVTRNYAGGILHGESTYTFPGRKLIHKKEDYHQGSLVAEHRYYPDGSPCQHVAYHPPDGRTITMWYQNGALQRREEMQGDRLVCGAYYNFAEQLESSVVDSHGLRTCRGALGQLESVDTLSEGKMVMRATYYPNGMPAALTPYVDGEIEGCRRTFLLGGEPATLETWQGNAQHGLTTLFEQGEKWAEVPYVKGYRHGVERRYREDQTLVQELTWVQGQQHGPAYTYIGGATQVDWFFRGAPVPNQAAFDMLSNQ